jgi:hypothetical protein
MLLLLAPVQQLPEEVEVSEGPDVTDQDEEEPQVHDETADPQERIDPQEPLQGEHIHQRVYQPTQAALGARKEGEMGRGRSLLPPPVDPVRQPAEEDGDGDIGGDIVEQKGQGCHRHLLGL